MAGRDPTTHKRIRCGCGRTDLKYLGVERTKKGNIVDIYKCPDRRRCGRTTKVRHSKGSP